MAKKKHIWRIRDKYLNQLKRGDKGLEIRVGYAHVKEVCTGDIIAFENHEEDEFYVKRIEVYPSFHKLLEVEGVSQVLPGLSFRDALQTLQRIYPPSKEALGVYAFALRYLGDREPTREYYKASDLLKAGDRKLFSRLIMQSYTLTDWISRDYPDHCDHFYSKYVPGIFDGEREIISCYINRKIAATAFLKRDSQERKISTFYVKPEYQKQGVASELIEKCFDWLGTTTPLITIADYKIKQFEGIIKKYGWVDMQTLSDGYYNEHSREHAFNGVIK